MAYLPPIFASSTFSFPDIFGSDKSSQSNKAQLSTIPTSTLVDEVTNGPSHTSSTSTNQALPLCPKEPISSTAEPSRVCRKMLRDSGITTTTQYAMPPAPVPNSGHVSLRTTNLLRQLPASASLSPNSIASSNSPYQCFGPSSSGSSPATTISPADSQVPDYDWVAQHVVVAPSSPPRDINHRQASTSRASHDGNVTGLNVAHTDSVHPSTRSRKRRADETLSGQPTRKRRSGECPHCNKQSVSRSYHLASKAYIYSYAQAPSSRSKLPEKHAL
jgi:hypothetical protein